MNLFTLILYKLQKQLSNEIFQPPVVIIIDQSETSHDRAKTYYWPINMTGHGPKVILSPMDGQRLSFIMFWCLKVLYTGFHCHAIENENQIHQIDE